MSGARTVQSVMGEVALDDLGIVLPHEHVFMDAYDNSLNSRMILSDPAIAVDELRLYKAAGGTTIVDQTPYGLYPKPKALRDVAQAAGVQIIAGTGVYWENFHPLWIREMSELEIARVFVRDLTVGIDGTDVRAGILGELASGHRAISPAEERVFRAAAVAQREVPVPIATHALFTQVGLDQVRCLGSAGANLDKVVIGHCDTYLDVDYHERLLREGVWVAYDCIGQVDKVTDDARARAVADLVVRGFANRLLLSSDVGYRSSLRYFGGGGYGHVILSFLPMLKAEGIGDETIRTLTVENPRELFTP